MNSAAGGIQRVFAPLTDQIFHNAFLRYLVRTDIEKFCLTEESGSNRMQGKTWFINVHLMLSCRKYEIDFSKVVTLHNINIDDVVI